MRGQNAENAEKCLRQEFPEPVADQNLNRRKVLDLQHEINQLQILAARSFQSLRSWTSWSWGVEELI